MRCLIGLVALLLVAGCGGANNATEAMPHPPQGKSVFVHFRFDALGMASNVPSTVTAHNLNGADVVLFGELLETNSSWLVIKRLDREGRHYIPLANVLHVTTEE